MRTWSLKLNSLDILTASPHYLCKKYMVTRKENLLFGTTVGLKGLRSDDHSYSNDVSLLLLHIQLCNVYELSLSGAIYNLEEYKEAMSLLR